MQGVGGGLWLSDRGVGGGGGAQSGSDAAGGGGGTAEQNRRDEDYPPACQLGAVLSQLLHEEIIQCFTHFF